MRTVLWGAGYNTHIFLERFFPKIRKDVEIAAVVDSYKEDVKIAGFKVDSAAVLKEIKYDYIVVMTSIFEEEVVEKIIKDEICNKKRIIRIYEFYSKILENMKTFEKKVVFVGDYNKYMRAKYRSEFLFLKSQYSSEIEMIHDADMYFICAPVYYGESRYDNEMHMYLLGKGISADKIWKSYEWESFLFSDLKYEFGYNNPDKCFYIIATSEPLTGWAMILKVVLSGIDYAKKRGMIPVVDMKNAPNMYLEEKDIGKKNIWDDYFEPLNDFKLDDVYKSKNVIIGAGVPKKYKANADVIHLRADFKKKIMNWKQEHFPVNDKVLGVIYRGTDYNCAYGHATPIPIEEYVGLVNEYLNEINYKYVFLATEVADATDIFREYFGDRVFFTDQARFPANERRWLGSISFDRENDKHKKSEEYLMVLYLLAFCDSLMGQECSAEKLAELLKKGDYEYIYKI